MSKPETVRLPGGGGTLIVVQVVGVVLACSVGWTVLVVAAAVGLTAGALLGLASTGIALTGRSVGETPVRTPDRPQGPRERASEPAWPTYFLAQPGHDLYNAVTMALGAGTYVIERGWPVLRQQYLLALALWPLMVPALCFTLALLVGIAAVQLLVAAVFVAVTLVAWLLGVSAVVGLRGLDRLRLWRLRTQAVCHQCVLPTDHPVFCCPRCARLHRRLRPDRYGVIWRRCVCGERLPATVWRAAATLTPLCSRCLDHPPLTPGAARSTDIRVGVFGPTSAGKTRLVTVGLLGLYARATDTGAVPTFPIDAHERAFAVARAAFAAGTLDPAKTQENAHPVAYTLRVQSARQNAIVHLLDAAGELSTDRARTGRLYYLGRASALLYTIDPFSIAEVRDATTLDADDLARAHPAADDPREGYDATVTWLHDSGVATRALPLALVVTKADLLCRDGALAAPRPESDAIRDWLVRYGLGPLVTRAGRDFPRLRYFLTSAVTPVDGAAVSPRWAPPDEPLAWLLTECRAEFSVRRSA